VTVLVKIHKLIVLKYFLLHFRIIRNIDNTDGAGTEEINLLAK